ncbi:NisI/SpaI family lantibiotic immunity lipoprotein [Saccharibacillus endophyticus]|uniref:DUF3221 domain-containing protein n=1 Tax=Saccharibacillus endophyticus TaxID=2060666 RepID=A0ABQ1ZLW7_9BACL|nr:NisI/SpaI family lantibiotic immunity lipoprotein [Saccharibacillus endophyticus]GGH67984.1 hypothetical protein GCM10007362_01530 [Saccharibacillus endophyticus]
MKSLFTVFLALLFVTGCSTQSEGTYPNVVSLNGNLYGVSLEKVTQDNIGNQLGEVKRIAKVMPKANEEANDTPVGSKLFEIKGIAPSEAIAVEINGTYQKATLNGPLN